MNFKKMGALIQVKNRSAHVVGNTVLHAAQVEAKELRGGAALILAALYAGGTSIILNPHYIDRGYEDICRDLQKLGASCYRKTGLKK